MRLYSRKIVGCVHDSDHAAHLAGRQTLVLATPGHSGIQYVSPSQRHEGKDQAILAARHALYLQAREKNPSRWSGDARNWSPIGEVTLNSERDCITATYGGVL